MDERKCKILQAVIDEYIKTGEPVGSNSLIKQLNMPVSSATVRNDMVLLEKLGYLEQPHTSAGRVPTHLGYRYYINNLMTPKQLTTKEKTLIDTLLLQNDITADSVVENAVNVLADLTKMTVITSSKIPIFSMITRVEVIPAGRRLYALLIITSTGTIKNKICRLEFDLTYEQLNFFEKFINDTLTGVNIDSLNPAMLQNIAVALGSYMISLSPLLHEVYKLTEEINKTTINFTGEQNLLSQKSFHANEVVDLLNHKNELEGLLSTALDGISIVFGNENDSFAISNSSMIMSPYSIGSQKGGSFGLIGPARIDYAKVIPYVEYFSKSVTKILSGIVLKNDDDNDCKS
ncbi:MAG: heat-inducible transcriptional repressor HrcA [Oscillospiraceae bacterium]